MKKVKSIIAIMMVFVMALGLAACGSGIGRSGPNMQALAKSGTWLDGRRFSASVSEADLKTWTDGFK